MQRYEELRKAKAAFEARALEDTRRTEADHLRAAEALESLYEKKLKEVNSKVEELSQEKVCVAPSVALARAILYIY